MSKIDLGVKEIRIESMMFTCDRCGSLTVITEKHIPSEIIKCHSCGRQFRILSLPVMKEIVAEKDGVLEPYPKLEELVDEFSNGGEIRNGR